MKALMIRFVTIAAFTESKINIIIQLVVVFINSRTPRKTVILETGFQSIDFIVAEVVALYLNAKLSFGIKIRTVCIGIQAQTITLYVVVTYESGQIVVAKWAIIGSIHILFIIHFTTSC